MREEQKAHSKLNARLRNVSMQKLNQLTRRLEIVDPKSGARTRNTTPFRSRSSLMIHEIENEHDMNMNKRLDVSNLSSDADEQSRAEQKDVTGQAPMMSWAGGQGVLAPISMVIQRQETDLQSSNERSGMCRPPKQFASLDKT